MGLHFRLTQRIPVLNDLLLTFGIRLFGVKGTVFQ